MARITVSPELLQSLAAQLRGASAFLEAQDQRLARAVRELDWQVQGGADIIVEWQNAHRRAADLALELERLAGLARRKAEWFDRADRTCSDDYSRVASQLRARTDLWITGDGGKDPASQKKVLE